MKALAYFGKNDVRIVEKPEPRIEDPRDAIVRVTTAAICGSDLHLYHGLVPDTRVGHTFGHECVGVVEEVGSAVTRLKRGDRVVVPFNISCGECFFCQKRLWACCERSNPYNEMGGVFGYSHMTGGYDGMQAEYARVPFADVGPQLVPADVSDQQAIMLADVFPTGTYGAERAEIQPGDTVAVFGCGPVGLFALWAARSIYHAGRLIVVDHLPYRLELAARQLGAETVNFDEVPDVVEHIRGLTGGRGPDACIDAVGLEADGSLLHDVQGAMFFEAGSIVALTWAMNAVRPGGTVSVVGVYGPPFNHFFPLGWAMNRGLSLRMGQCNVLNYFDDLLARSQRSEVDPAFVVTHELPLAEAPRGYELFERKLDGAIKILLHPR